MISQARLLCCRCLLCCCTLRSSQMLSIQSTSKPSSCAARFRISCRRCLEGVFLLSREGSDSSGPVWVAKEDHVPFRGGAVPIAIHHNRKWSFFDARLADMFFSLCTKQNTREWYQRFPGKNKS